MVLSLKPFNQLVWNSVYIIELFNLVLAALKDNLKLFILSFEELNSFVCVPKRFWDLLVLFFLLVYYSFLFFNLRKKIISLVIERIDLLLQVLDIFLSLIEFSLHTGKLVLQALALRSQVL